MKKTIKRKLAIMLLLSILPLLVVFLYPGCASGPNEKSDKSTLSIRLSVSEKGGIDVDGNGYYAILFNGFSEEIEVTNYETFTDFIRFDGFNFTWYHRQGNVPSPGYTWVDAGNMNAESSISSGGNSIIVRIDLNDYTNLFNQYIESRRFTIHAVTTDQSSSLLGKTIDTLGPGPAIDGNSLYSIYFDKLTGVLDPQPPQYPSDPLGDYIQRQTAKESIPYDNFDIETFTVELE